MKTPAADSGLGLRRFAGLMGPRLIHSAPDTEAASNPETEALSPAQPAELETHFDPLPGLLSCNFSANPPVLTSRLLENMAAAQDLAAASHRAAGQPVRYMAWGATAESGAWNLGGDLNAVADMARARDRDGLVRYATTIASIGERNHRALDLPVVTVALVGGNALGLGFETALSANVIIAEESARFGMPESLFNLMPGIAAYSYLARRANPGLAERIIMSGALYSADDLYRMGVVDMVCGDGRLQETLYGFMGRDESRHRFQRSTYDLRRRISPINPGEIDTAVASWVESALGLVERDLQIMARLTRSQARQGR